MKADKLKKKMKPCKKIRKGDTVIAITGNAKGQTGTVISCDGYKAIVQGLNVRKKHIKKSQEAPEGGIIEIEKPINVSNLKVCTEDGRPVKLKIQKDDAGKRHFYYKDGEKEVVYRSVKNHNK